MTEYYKQMNKFLDENYFNASSLEVTKNAVNRVFDTLYIIRHMNTNKWSTEISVKTKKS